MSTSIKNKLRKIAKTLDEAQDLVDNAPVMMWKMDNKGKLVYSNQKWDDFIGMECESPIYDKNVVHKDDFDMALLLFNQAAKDQKSIFEDERRLKEYATGEYHWFLTRAVYVSGIGEDSSGEWIGTSSNVEEIKHLREELEKAKKWWQTMGDSVAVILYAADGKGNVNYYNNTWYETVGDDNNWIKVVHPDDVENVLETFTETVKEKKNFHLSSFRLWHKTKKEYRWFTSQAFYLKNGPFETKWLGTTVDVHDLTIANEKLKYSDFMFEIISENVPIVINVMNEEAIVTSISGSTFERLPDVPCPKIGDDFRKYVSGIQNMKDDVELVDQVIHFGKEISFLREFSGRFLKISWIPIRRDGNKEITGMLSITIDVSSEQTALREKRELEMKESIAQESNRIKTQFLANMSHELRTPLNGILGMSEMLLDLITNKEHVGYLETIVSNVNYLTSLVNDIIDISRIESGKLDIQLLPFDVKAILKDVTDNFKMTIQEKRIHLSTDVTIKENMLVVCDPVRFRQILWNMIGNAVKFTLEGGVDITINCDNKVMTIGIQDTGIGMSKETLENLYKPFTQGETMNTRRFAGTGLGVFITKLILDKMNGTIEYISEEHVGTNVMISLPIELKSLDTMESHDEYVFSTSKLKGKHALIAEDNVVNQTIARRILEKFDMRVTTSFNGKEALEYFKDNKDDIDIVLMDIQMPVMDGYEALHEIRKISQVVPVVAMTASAMKDDIIRSYREGMSDHISKPFRSEELVRTVIKNLNLHVSQVLINQWQ
jgi:PAS domain S-box-containing protein